MGPSIPLGLVVTVWLAATLMGCGGGKSPTISASDGAAGGGGTTGGVHPGGTTTGGTTSMVPTTGDAGSDTTGGATGTPTTGGAAQAGETATGGMPPGANDSTLSFSHSRGFYNEPFALSITVEPPDSTLRYTLDGSVPSLQNGADYTGPISIDGTTALRVVVIENGAISTLPADSTLPWVRTHTYIFPEQVIQQGDERPSGDFVFWTTEMDPEISGDPRYGDSLLQSLTDLPSLSIVTDPESLFGEAGIHRGNNLMEGEGSHAGAADHPDAPEEIGISLELIYPTGYKEDAYSGFQIDCGLKIQGGGGRWDNGEYDHKQSFSLRFRSVYGYPSLRYPFFEDAPLNAGSATRKYDKMVLRAGHNKSWGATWDPEHSAYTRDQLGRDLQIDSTGYGSHGTFMHLYLNGLYWGLYNPSERPDDAFAAAYFEGSEEDFYVGKHKGGHIDGDPARYTEWLERVGQGTDFAELEQLLDVDAYIDMSLINTYAATGDFPQYYYTVCNNPPGPVRFWTWDTEDAFGGGSERTSDTPQIDRLGKIYNFDEMYGNMPEFRARWAERVGLHTGPGGVLSDEHVLANWAALNDYIRLAIVAESARWGDERISDTGTRFTQEHWRAAVDAVSDGTQGKAARLLQALEEAGRLD